MKQKIIIIGLLVSVVLGLIVFVLVYPVPSEPKESKTVLPKKTATIRQAAFADAFYPGQKSELENQVDQFLKNAQVSPISGRIKIVIVPHAGYIYSGQVAGFGFKSLLENTDIQSAKRIILLGSGHSQYVKGRLVIDANDYWETPLGKTALDNGLRTKLAKKSRLFQIDSLPHAQEHSLEVELPFLQRIFPKFTILPILVNELNVQDLETAGQILAEVIDENTLVVVSTDLSHYPAYEDAKITDQKTIEAILTGKIENLKNAAGSLEKANIANLVTSACGQQAVALGMKMAEKIEADKIQLLKSANSGDVPAGDKARVVGYAAIIFSSQRAGDGLSREEQLELLGLAKKSVETFVKEGKVPAFKTDDFFLNKPQGAFVTLKEDNNLRGCIGAFEPTEPLYQVVSQMAIAAAAQDRRFVPVTIDELPDIEYEISVLSPLRKINSWQEIEIGKHGVQIRQGLKSGVFLPQVATENHWDLTEFMSELCFQKAGLSRDCWKDPATELYIFTAQVFE